MLTGRRSLEVVVPAQIRPRTSAPNPAGRLARNAGQEVLIRARGACWGAPPRSALSAFLQEPASEGKIVCGSDSDQQARDDLQID
jgi:hypothetical protein